VDIFFNGVRVGQTAGGSLDASTVLSPPNMAAYRPTCAFSKHQTSLSDLKEGGMTSKLDSLSFGEKIGERRNAGG
jgi:hypothetical protein